MKEETFQNGLEPDWSLRTLFFELVKEGIKSFKFLSEESKRKGYEF